MNKYHGAIFSKNGKIKAFCACKKHLISKNLYTKMKQGQDYTCKKCNTQIFIKTEKTKSKDKIIKELKKEVKRLKKLLK